MNPKLNTQFSIPIKTFKDLLNRKTYYIEYDPKYIPKEQIKNIEKHAKDIKRGAKPTPIYIPIEIKNFSGASIIYSEQGTPTHILFTDEAETIVDLQNKLTIDPMTGISNRYGWRTEITKLAETIQRGEIDNKYMTLAIFDLNNLKVINDQKGHEQGDIYILRMAKHLKNTFRLYDEIARWGGDEFVAFALSNRDIIQTIERKLMENKSADLNYCAGILGFSIRSILDELRKRSDSTFENRTKIVLDILKEKFNQADKLLYQAKQQVEEETENGIKPTVIKCISV